jgi:hypothetical protein
MDFYAILKAQAPKGPIKANAKILPPASTFPAVTDDQTDNEELLKRRQAAAVYATAQEGTVAGFPSPPPNY